MSRRALGKGLDALIPEVKRDAVPGRSEIVELDISEIAANQDLKTTFSLIDNLRTVLVTAAQ